jgi:hypothetical protein
MDTEPEPTDAEAPGESPDGEVEDGMRTVIAPEMFASEVADARFFFLLWCL